MKKTVFTKTDEAIKLYETGFTQTEVAEILGTTQKVIWRVFRNANYTCRIAKKRNQVGINNDSLKGDGAMYAAFHYRVVKLHGQPSLCENCRTTKAKCYEWANVNGMYHDPYDYVRLCKSCHALFDGIINNIRKEVNP